MRILIHVVAASLLIAATVVLAAPATPLRITGEYDPLPVEMLEPKELWRITDSDDDAGDILGEIRDATVDDDGNTLLLDASFNTVRMYDPDGVFLGTVGREGDGPGEFRNPESCLALADGRVGVAQLMPGRIITIERTGDPGKPVDLPGEGSMRILVNAQTAAGGIYVCTTSMQMNEDSMTSVTQLQSLDLDGTLRAVIKEKTEDIDVSGGTMALRAGGPDDFTRYWAAGPDGRVYVSPHYDAYQVDVHGPDGNVERVIAMDYDHVKRTAEEIAELEEQRTGTYSFGELDLGPIEPALRDIAAIHPRPDGSLWVISSRARRDRPDGAVGAFDVFDRKDRLVRRVALAADFDPDYDEFVISGNRLYVLKEALSAPASGPSSAGDGAMVLRIGQPRQQDDDREPMPYSVICYDLRGI